MLEMLISGALVFAFLLPLGLAAWWAVQRSASPVLPRVQPWYGPWTFFEVVVVFLVVSILIPETLGMWLYKAEGTTRVAVNTIPPETASAAIAGMPIATVLEEQNRQIEIANIIHSLWSRTLALPLQLTLLLGAARILYPRWWFMPRPSLAAQVLLAIAAWIVLTPLVLGLNAVVSTIFDAEGWKPDEHPLSKLSGQSLGVSALIVVQACVAAPITEELIFRGLILAWAIGSRRPRSVPDVPAQFRGWLIASFGLLFAAASGKNGPIVFSMILLAGLAFVRFWFRGKRRTCSAVYSSAAFFAMVHSSVWPSPIPLFILGLGLGWLAVRTRSLLVPIMVHGFFNAVSTVFVLRGMG